MASDASVIPTILCFVGIRYCSLHRFSITSTPAVHVWHPVSATASMCFACVFPTRDPFHFAPNFSCAPCITVTATFSFGGNAGFLGWNSPLIHTRCDWLLRCSFTTEAAYARSSDFVAARCILARAAAFIFCFRAFRIFLCLIRRALLADRDENPVDCHYDAMHCHLLLSLQRSMMSMLRFAHFLLRHHL